MSYIQYLQFKFLCVGYAAEWAISTYAGSAADCTGKIIQQMQALHPVFMSHILCAGITHIFLLPNISDVCVQIRSTDDRRLLCCNAEEGLSLLSDGEIQAAGMHNTVAIAFFVLLL